VFSTFSQLVHNVGTSRHEPSSASHPARAIRRKPLMRALMSEKLIVDLFQAVDSRDWNALRAIFHPEIAYERPGYKRFEGISQVMRFYEYDRILVSGKHDTECIVVNGNKGACWGPFIGMKNDNSNADERFADVYFFKDGMVRMRKTYFFRAAI
jgi:ketosteroid isomerase-like protein